MDFNKPVTLNLNGDIASNFESFKEEVNIYFIATETVKKSKEVQVARLKNLLGSDGLKLYNTLSNSSSGNESVESILEILEQYCMPKQNITMDIYKLLSRKQLADEPFDRFHADLKSLIRPCKFLDQEEKVLKALIALGIRSKETQQRLLRDDLSLEKVINFCKSVELANKNMELISKEQEENRRVDEVLQNQVLQVTKTSNGKSTFENKSMCPDTLRTSHYFGKHCNRCGREHTTQCPAMGKVCNYCLKPNHFSNMCRLKMNKIRPNGRLFNKVQDVQKINDEPTDQLEEQQINSLYIVNSVGKKSAWYKEVLINQAKINFKLDSGADVNILPLHTLKKHRFPLQTLEKCNIRLEAYGGFKISPIGCLHLAVETESKISVVEFIIVNNCSAIPILGLDACIDLNLIKRINSISKDKQNQLDQEKMSIYKNNRNCFEGLGCFPDVCKIKLDKNAMPSINLARRIPLKIKEKFRETLQSLKSKGIITPVEEPVDWISNIVVVEKPDGSLRVCIDPVELNKYIIRERYTIPTIGELAPNLSHKKVFTILDIKDAFYHIALDDESSKLCSFSSEFGTFRFLRAPFGLSCLPELFQRLVHKYFGDIQGLSLYFDDLCIATNSKEENDKILKQVLQRANKFNIKFNFKKFQYCVPQVKYVGMIFCEKGMLPDPDKIKSIETLEIPKNKQDLQRMLGMINYLRGFIPNMSELISPLRQLLKKDVEWSWTETQTCAFNKIKVIICSNQVLAAFDPSSSIEVQCDASKDALGFCMLQHNKPVHFGSRSMTPTEESYAQVEKELLAICYATKKLHNYIYGHSNVTILTDHMPLVSIISKPMDKILNNRLKRLKLKLIDYQLKIQYLPGKYMFIADYMSRTGVRTASEDDCNMKDYVHALGSADVEISENKLKEFQEKSGTDMTIQEITLYLHQGWPEVKTLNGDAKHMFKLKNDLQLNNGLLYYGTRLVVPKSLREFIMRLLHETHLGSSKMNALVNRYYYWPAIQSDIKNLISSCDVCQKYSRSNIKDPLLSHEIPNIPFYKVAVDVAEFNRLNYLVLIDYYSRWIEVYQIINKTSTTIIKKLKDIFSRLGIPKTVIADNMPFDSYEMKMFAKEWNFQIITSSPYHPKSNGLAEKGVGIVKDMLKKSKEQKQEMELYLLNYRNAPVADLGVSPSQLLNSRNLRTKLPIDEDNFKPRIVPEAVFERMNAKQVSQKVNYDKTALQIEKEFKDGQNVWVQNSFNKNWEKGQVVKKLPQPRSYLVKVNDGSIRKRNVIHLKKAGQ